MPDKKAMPATDSARVLHDLVGDDATAEFENDPKFEDTDPTASASSENLAAMRDTDDEEDSDDELEDDDEEEDEEDYDDEDAEDVDDDEEEDIEEEDEEQEEEEDEPDEELAARSSLKLFLKQAA